MCRLERLHCPDCGIISEYGFGICKKYDELDNKDLINAHDEEYHLLDRNFFFRCENFAWPPVQPIPLIRQVCDRCDPLRTYYDKTVIGLGPQLRKASRLNRNGNVEKIDAPNTDSNALRARLGELPHRVLTIRIPYCKLCNQPDMFTKKCRGKTIFGIKGVELEGNSILGKWWCSKAARPWVSTEILTGFIHKPCTSCVDREIDMRRRVLEFRQTCNSLEAWAVWNWLTLRGTGLVDFFSHETTNIGLPDSEPPDLRQFQAIMANGWKARTGFPFEEVIELDNLCISLPFTPHHRPFLTLSEWNGFVGVRPRMVLDSALMPLTSAGFTHMVTFDSLTPVTDDADTEMVDRRHRRGFFRLSEFGTWHLQGSKDALARWRLSPVASQMYIQDAEESEEESEESSDKDSSSDGF
ncbi:uncharacterized protein F4822DRAFT_426021 [Hypoxylon trugodes]|uniref:uncharacterized protein n=1 Tax=Hypoxylon trugodes TaxID=326681 RepID=UPI0021963B31|nr:uncharacterized protein F4822DRAFT_426021 [Hypoxylon trugodes]KAI1392814.1 hypothetical protein F4822DRAFT_426021 [Hypoxylon trugodes]